MELGGRQADRGGRTGEGPGGSRWPGPVGSPGGLGCRPEPEPPAGDRRAEITHRARRKQKHQQQYYTKNNTMTHLTL